MLELLLVVLFFALLIGIFRRVKKPTRYRFVDRWSTPEKIAEATAANRIRDGLTPYPPTAQDIENVMRHQARR
jgi:hypothetical protein